MINSRYSSMTVSTSATGVRGFTLVEVLVALVVVSLALPSLLVNIMQQLDNTGHLRDKSIASWVAANKMTELRLANRLTQALPGNKVDGETEMAGRTWYWRVERKPYQVPLPLVKLDKLEAVQVTVFYDKQREDSLTQLFGVLRSP